MGIRLTEILSKSHEIGMALRGGGARKNFDNDVFGDIDARVVFPTHP